MIGSLARQKNSHGGMEYFNNFPSKAGNRIIPFPSVHDRTPRPLQQILQYISGYRCAKILFTAVSLDLFGKLKNGKRSVKEIARSLNSDFRACEIFLDALCSLGYLDKKNNLYSNSDIATSFLLKDSPFSVFHNLRYQDLIWSGWSQLQSSLRVGAPQRDLLGYLRDPHFISNYILAMKEIARVSAPDVARHLSSDEVGNILDIGTGSGSYSIELLKKCPKASADLLDLSSTLKVTKTLIPQKYFKRIKFVSGNYNVVDFGNSKFDLILLSHVTHDEGESENKTILRKAFSALKPDGRIAIHDFMLNSEKTKPLFGCLFAVHMLSYTRKGRAYSRDQYISWLISSGFRNIGTFRICAGAEFETGLLVGEKRRN